VWKVLAIGASRWCRPAGRGRGGGCWPARQARGRGRRERFEQGLGDLDARWPPFYGSAGGGSSPPRSSTGGLGTGGLEIYLVLSLLGTPATARIALIVNLRERA